MKSTSLSALVSYISKVLHHQKSSRKFKEFCYKKFRCFVKYSWAQENVRESSKSYDQRQ